MTFKEFLEACSTHGQTVFGLCVAIFVTLIILLVGAYQIISLFKQKNYEEVTEDDTDNG